MSSVECLGRTIPCPSAGIWFAQPRRTVSHSCVASHSLEDRLICFGATACQLGQRLPRTPVGQHVALQLARSSTSAFANYGEVQAAESRRDFIHKLGICLKELRETHAWLKFIRRMDLVPVESIEPVLRECNELVAILVASVTTARRNGRGANEE